MKNSADFHTAQKRITELCHVERAVGGKTYPAGSCYVKLSAVDDFVGQLKKDGPVESRYAVLELKPGLNQDYFYIAVKRSFPNFLRRYRTTINLQFDTLKFFTVDWHEDVNAQKQIVTNVKMVDEAISEITSQIEDEKEVKRFFLGKMFI